MHRMIRGDKLHITVSQHAHPGSMYYIVDLFGLPGT